MTCFTQVNIDSLLNIIALTDNDSIKYENYVTAIQEIRFTDLEKAKEYCKEIYKISKRYNPIETKAMADYYMGYYYKIKGNAEEAIPLYRNVVSFGKETGNLNFEAAGLSEIASLYELKGETDKALKVYFEVFDLFQEAENIEAQLVVENNIGLLYQNLQELDKALEFYKNAFKKSVKHNSKYNEEMLAGNIASIYISLEKLDSATYYTKQCLKIAKELKYERSIGFANQLMATIVLEKRKFNAGLDFGLSALESYQKLDDKVLMVDLFPVLSLLYYNIKNYSEAEKYSKLAIEYGKELKYDEGIKDGYLTLSNIQEKQGHYKEAFESFKEYKILNDSISNHTKLKNINELQIKYDSANKDLEIRSQEIELVKKTSQRNIFMAGLILLFLLALFLWYKNILQKKLSKSKIEGLEQEQKFLAADFILQGQEEERKRIATDLHDGLGGILATAKLQLQNIDQEIDKLQSLNLMAKAESLIGDAYSEVRRIAHDMMPSSLINLGFKSAVEDLADQINLTNTIFVKTQFYASDIPHKKAVVLYRIIQEAMSNTLKHANAKNIIIQFSESDSSFLLTIEDDGVGFDMKNEKGLNGLGIKNIKSRINYLNGELNLWSEKGKGTGYEIEIPK